MKNRTEYRIEPRVDCSGNGILTFGMALVSGHEMLSDDDRDDGIDPEYNLYRNGTGVYVQMKSPLDGRYDDNAAEAQDTFELREDLFDEGAWHDEDESGYSDIARADIAVSGHEPPTQVEYDDAYANLADEYHVVDTVADWAYDQAVHSLISSKKPVSGGRRQSVKPYFTTRRQTDIARQMEHDAIRAWRANHDDDRAEWLSRQAPSSKFDPRVHLPASSDRDPFTSLGIERRSHQNVRIVTTA